MVLSSGRNPYFIGILSAIKKEFERLFEFIRCHNPYFIGILSAIHWAQAEGVHLNLKSQSLFYWNPFCNKYNMLKPFYGLNVAILILLESFLQLKILKEGLIGNEWSRNPYFIGILSAILILLSSTKMFQGRNPYFIGILSAIQPKYVTVEGWNTRRNPYFIGILSAIIVTLYFGNIGIQVAILILLESFLQ